MLSYVTDANIIIPIASAEVFASRLIILLNVALVAWGLFEAYALLFGSKVWTYIMEPISSAFWTPIGLSIVCLFIGGSFLILTAKLLDEICDKITERIQSLKTEIYEKEQQIAKMQNTINDLQSLKIQIPDTELFTQSKKTI
jgi:hypothetical protein